VCALFHDIGKSVNPAYFTENQRDRINPHDALDPVVSAKIIRQHVEYGVELGLKHRLPRAVIDVIRQHHGTTHVRYFYERALAFRARHAGGARLGEPAGAPRRGDGQAPDAPPIDEALFRYEGPRPQFRESAIISLADGAEAASRSMRSATAEQFGQLIESIVNDRIAQGQLNEAPLTLEDIAKVKNSFTFTLTNVLHSRVAYAAEADPGAGNSGGLAPSSGAI
jgi:putative nucleotidyltransferase with HDIG domain